MLARIAKSFRKQCGLGFAGNEFKWTLDTGVRPSSEIHILEWSEYWGAVQEVSDQVRLLGLHVRTNVLSNDGPSPLGAATVKEEHQAHGRKGPCADRPSAKLARDHKAGRRTEPRVSRVGQLLQCRLVSPSLSRARQLHSRAVAPMAAVQTQGQATPSRDVSTLAPLPGL